MVRCRHEASALREVTPLATRTMTADAAGETFGTGLGPESGSVRFPLRRSAYVSIIAATREDAMAVQIGISRRRALEMTIAAMGGLAMAGGAGHAQTPPTPKIEQLAPELEKIIATSEPIQHLADGFGGTLGPAEGPLWWKEGKYLLFSDIHNNKRMKYEPGKGVSVFLEPTNRANGLTRDLQGRLLACEHDSRRITRLEPDGSLTVLASSFQGRQLNRPNDVVVKSDGCIYFTDPWGHPAGAQQWDLTFAGVYRVTPDLGQMTLLIDDFVTPNGLAFSPDESVLYIKDSRRGHIRAFDLLPNGLLAKQTDRVFVDLRGPESGNPDGMKVDVEGNVYCGGAGGLWIMDSKGKKLGRIVHGAPATTNLAFGGADWKTLYFTSRNHLGAVNVKIPGIPVPVGRK
jgi:gluconolactonase